MKRDGNATRLTLMRTAEQLFRDNGVEAVSLREVSEAAQQRNHAAAGYHFGSKEGLVDAILARHSAAIHAGYDVAMDAVEARGGASVEELLRILVTPIVGKLDDEDGGHCYLSLCAQLSVSERMPLETRAVAGTPAVLRIWGTLATLVDVDAGTLPLRLARVASFIYTSTLQYHRLHRFGVVVLDRAAFIDDLVVTLGRLVKP